MTRSLFAVLALLTVCQLQTANAAAPATPDVAEIKLLSPLDESRGWCVDLFAHLTNAKPLGGFQGHTCFLYFGRGPQVDQGFVEEEISEGKFELPYWHVCMTLQEPANHSYVQAEPCVGEPAQKFTMHDNGRITADMAPQLCLTIGAITVPGGGRLAPIGTRPPPDNSEVHQIRGLSFDDCSDAETVAVRQTWTLRKGKFVPEKTTMPHRFMEAQK